MQIAECLTAKSAISRDVENGKIISGIPAFDNRDWLRSTAAFRRLGEMAKTIRDLEKRLGELEKNNWIFISAHQVCAWFHLERTALTFGQFYILPLFSFL